MDRSQRPSFAEGVIRDEGEVAEQRIQASVILDMDSQHVLPFLRQPRRRAETVLQVVGTHLIIIGRRQQIQPVEAAVGAVL